ncbi:MAG: hypothetical protein B7Z68_07540 [Acidobacteria bacterium 21-70-11]|nr:MAG: hypothetical protein B7Z68_07540 [Acidobacteria bacterium 21-70-11]
MMRTMLILLLVSTHCFGDVVIANQTFTSAADDCLTVVANTVLLNDNIGPCHGVGVHVIGSGVEIVNSYIHDTAGVGVLVDNANNTHISGGAIERVATGVYAYQSQGVSVLGVTFGVLKGPMPRGQCVQFNEVTGPGNRVMGNWCQGATADSFNLYKSEGTAASPITIANNTVPSGSINHSSCGIILGDQGGAYQTAIGNRLTDPGSCGIGVAGGHDIAVTNNTIAGAQSPVTNVGLYVWAQGGVPCSNITASGNTVNWVNAGGERNRVWNGGNCGDIAGWDKNQ